MKCEIIRDLLPSYADGLVSEESKKEIEAHLEQCEECAEINRHMKEQIPGDGESVKREIKPFKKLNRAVLKAVSIVIIICIALGGAFYAFFVGGWTPKKESVSLDYSCDGESILFNFQCDEGSCLTVKSKDKTDSKNVYELTLKSMLKLPYDDRGRYPDRFTYGFSSEDEAGGKLCFGKDEKVVIHYRDHTDTVKLYDLAKQLGAAENAE